MNQDFYPVQEPVPETEAPAKPQPSETRRVFSRLGLSLATLMAVLILAVYAIELSVFFTAPEWLNAWWMRWVVSLLPLYGVALPCAYLILRKIPVTPHNPDYLDRYRVTHEKPRFGFGHWMLLLVIGLGCMYLGNLAGTLLMQLLSELMDYDYANALNTIIEQSPTWMVFVGTCICAPIGEEFIFRKLLLDRTRGYGEGASILLSGLLFGLFHSNLFQFFYAFLLGMILAYIYTRSGKLRWCIAMHAVINFLGSIAVPGLAALVSADAEQLDMVGLFVALFLSLWTYGLMAAAVVLICTLWRTRKLSPGSIPLTRRQSAAYILGNPGMILCLVVMLLLLAVNLIPVRG